MDILQKITLNKKIEVDDLKIRYPLETIESRLDEIPRLPFREAIDIDDEVRIIAELKKGSPSKGVIRSDFSPVAIAREYHRGGAAALSVLTESTYFFGRHEYMGLAKKEAGLPILCKDFILDRYQLYYARHMGADAVLLIVRMHSPRTLAALLEEASKIGLDCLVETHNETEIKTALDAGASIVGVNNRDLTTFEVDLATSEKLAGLIPDDVTKVAESGIVTADDVRRLRPFGYGTFLIGEALMRARDASDLIRSLNEA